MSIDTLDWYVYSRSTFDQYMVNAPSTRGWHLSQHLVESLLIGIDTLSTLHWHGRQLVKSQLIFNWFIWVSWPLAHYWSSVHGVLTEYQPGCLLSVDREVSWWYCGVLIGTQRWMPLVHVWFKLSHRLFPIIALF